MKAAAKKTPEMPMAPVILVAGPATVAAEHVNLRGQAGLKGEVVGHAQKGDTVTVISEITLDKPKAGEPAQWAKIALPTGTKVWVDSKFIDITNNVVGVKKLNLRGGPGENYSVLGVIEKGAPITVVATKGDWTQIEPPASAFAFVAASYLKQEGPMIDTNVPARARGCQHGKCSAATDDSADDSDCSRGAAHRSAGYHAAAAPETTAPVTPPTTT